MKVLIAEDEIVSRQMLRSVLPMWGYDVVPCANGNDAWLVLQDADAPRLAILDWMMPGMDGIELTQRIRAAEGPYRYIIFLTAKSAKADVIAAMDAGADDYLAKPFDPHELRVRLDAAKRTLRWHDQLEHLADDLERKNVKLAELTDTAHRFVDNVSHEFRTPLTVIKEFTSIIADGLGGPVTDTQAEYLQSVTNAVNDLSQMVDDLLDSSKLKAGTLRVDRSAWTIEDVLAPVRPLVRAKLRARRIRLVEAVEPGLGRIFVDREKVGRIIVNLLVNAAKFSPEDSEVQLGVRADEHGDVEIAVSDQGSGLTPEEVELIFERFRQAGMGCASSAKGFGLGLSIARELAWLNLGTIRVESEPGRGSTFAFTLPPDDPAVVVDRFFRRLADLEERRRLLAVLRLDTDGTDAAREALRGFVIASCYPTDLVLRAGTGGLVAVGLTDDPDAWIRRVRAMHARAVRDTAGAERLPLTIECAGSWPFPQQREPATAVVLATLDRETARV